MIKIPPLYDATYSLTLYQLAIDITLTSVPSCR
jgi:hypothetical protein